MSNINDLKLLGIFVVIIVIIAGGYFIYNSNTDEDSGISEENGNILTEDNSGEKQTGDEENHPPPEDNKQDDTSTNENGDTNTGDNNQQGDSTVEVKEIQITAQKWKFTPEQITVNKGDQVKFIINSIDVDHGFAISEYNINQHLESQTTATVEFTAETEGTFTIYCSIFCGSGHHSMTGTLTVI